MNEGDINIQGLDKALLLAALYNGSAPIGYGIMQARPGDMDLATAQKLVEGGQDATGDYTPHAHLKPRGKDLYFDYVFGRPLKVDLGKDTLDPGLYDRDHGRGAAARIVEQLRAKSTPPSGASATV